MTEATPETEEEEAPQDDGGKEKEKMDVVESQVRFAIGTQIDLTIESIYSIWVKVNQLYSQIVNLSQLIRELTH